MTPRQASRYRDQPTVSFPVPGDDAARLLAPRVVPAGRTGGSYTVQPGDRLDLLGRAATGDTTRWWLLADANPWWDPAALEVAGRRIELPRG